MKFDILLTGVGGEGVLTSQVILARAANLEGYFVRGVQLHGLAQRGGSLQTVVRFAAGLERSREGDEKGISSPVIMQTNANLIMAFEPLEAVRAVYYARKEKTIFILEEEPLIPIYSHLLDIPYPNFDKIKEKIQPFAKEIHIFPARKVADKEFGDPILGNTILLGAAVGLGIVPLKKENLIEALKISVPRAGEENLKAFKRGLKLSS